MNENIIETLKIINQLEEVTLEDSNFILKKRFAGEYTTQSSQRNHLRSFTPWAVVNISPSSIEEFFKLINSVYKKLYTDKGSLDSILSNDVRTPTSRRFGYNSDQHIMSKKLVKISDKEKENLVMNQKTSLYKKSSNTHKFTHKEIIEIINKNIDHKNPFNRAVVLTMLSGSRPVELFGKAEFTLNREVGPEWVWQDYVAKKKGDLEPITKPILYIRPNDFILRLKQMREDLALKYPNPIKANGDLHSSVSEKVNEAAKDIFAGKEEGKGKVSLYIARKIYGNLSYNQFARTTTIFGQEPNFLVWLNNVLGHSQYSLETAMHYSTVKVSYF